MEIKWKISLNFPPLFLWWIVWKIKIINHRGARDTKVRHINKNFNSLSKLSMRGERKIVESLVGGKKEKLEKFQIRGGKFTSQTHLEAEIDWMSFSELSKFILIAQRFIIEF